MVNPAPALLRGRAAAESMMVDSCTIRRVTGKTTDPETGVITPTYAIVYSGKCRVQQKAPIDRPADVGQAMVWLQRLEIQLPVATSSGIATDDLATITASSLDPDLPGRLFHVRLLAHKSHATSRRIQGEEVTG